MAPAVAPPPVVPPIAPPTATLPVSSPVAITPAASEDEMFTDLLTQLLHVDVPPAVASTAASTVAPTTAPVQAAAKLQHVWRERMVARARCRAATVLQCAARRARAVAEVVAAERSAAAKRIAQLVERADEPAWLQEAEGALAESEQVWVVLQEREEELAEGLAATAALLEVAGRETVDTAVQAVEGGVEAAVQTVGELSMAWQTDRNEHAVRLRLQREREGSSAVVAAPAGPEVVAQQRASGTGGRQRRAARDARRDNARVQLGTLVGEAERRLEAVVGGGEQWRAVLEGRLEVARARWRVLQSVGDEERRFVAAAAAVGVKAEAGVVV